MQKFDKKIRDGAEEKGKKGKMGGEKRKKKRNPSEREGKKEEERNGSEQQRISGPSNMVDMQSKAVLMSN